MAKIGQSYQNSHNLIMHFESSGLRDIHTRAKQTWVESDVRRYRVKGSLSSRRKWKYIGVCVLNVCSVICFSLGHLSLSAVSEFSWYDARLYVSLSFFLTEPQYYFVLHFYNINFYYIHSLNASY